MNFSDYFALSASERERRRRELEAIPVGEKYQPQPDKPNYQAKQAPLAYVLMAIIDRALANLPLLSRVLWLRIFCAVVAVLMLAHATLLLVRELSLPEPYATAALFCIFSSQMLYAVLCHICNDGLAAPLLCYLAWSAIRGWRSGSARDWLVAGLALAAALLTKAYLLFVLPLPVVLLAWTVWRRRATLAACGAFCLPLLVAAAPWHVRNLVLYGNLTGTAETSDLHLLAFLKAVGSLPWLKSIGYTAYSSLWTGNNSFTTFSWVTLTFMLALIVAGSVVYVVSARRRIAELAVVSATALFSCGLAFISVAYYTATKYVVIAPAPWHSQVLVAPIMLLVFLGLSRVQPWGRLGLALCVASWAWLSIATYFVKLLPWYGGFAGKARAGTLWRWYIQSGAQRNEILGHTCMVGAHVLWALAGASALLALLQAGRLTFRAGDHPEAPARMNLP
jgi:hypothetical protein